MTYSPIVMFVYNRADHFEETFSALCKCKEAAQTDLYIFADGAKNEQGREKVEACRAAVHKLTQNCPFKTVKITESPENRGLAASVISGVTEIVNKYGRVIVIEDDCVASPYLLNFFNKGLDEFEGDTRIGAIAGYAPAVTFPEDYKADVFTCYRSCSWGWATWKDRWANVDWELKEFKNFCRDTRNVKRLNSNGADRFIRLYRQTKGNGSSWSVRFGAHLVKNNMLTLYPRFSYISNIGCDSTGIHSTSEDAETMAVDLSKAIPEPEIKFAEPDKRIQKILKKHYSGGIKSDIKRFAATVAVVAKVKFLR